VLIYASLKLTHGVMAHQTIRKLSEKTLVEKFSAKDANSEAETQLGEKFRGKIKTLTAHNLLCWKSATVKILSEITSISRAPK